MTRSDLSQEHNIYISEEEINLQINYKAKWAVLLNVLNCLKKKFMHIVGIEFFAQSSKALSTFEIEEEKYHKHEKVSLRLM